MDTNRSTTGAHAPEPLAVYRSKKLLARRQALADAGIEHLCHDLPGTDQLWWALQQVEERIRREFPVIWAESNADWVFADAGRLHSPDRPAPDVCRICRQRQATPQEARSAS
jgi:hypothetical protein